MHRVYALVSCEAELEKKQVTIDSNKHVGIYN